MAQCLYKADYYLKFPCIWSGKGNVGVSILYITASSKGQIVGHAHKKILKSICFVLIKIKGKGYKIIHGQSEKCTKKSTLISLKGRGDLVTSTTHVTSGFQYKE